jgi:hypothetical protein
MHHPQPPQTPQDISASHIHHVLHVGNVYMSPHPAQNTTTFNPPETPLPPVHTSFTPQYIPFSQEYYTPDTPILPHKKRRVYDETLPSFSSPSPAADSRSLRIEALTAEIEHLQKKLDKLTKERDLLGYKKRAPRLSITQKLDAMIKAIDGVAKWTLGEFLHHLFKLVNDDGAEVHRSPKHAAMMSQFLQGRTKYGPSDILDAWFQRVKTDVFDQHTFS